MVALVATHQHLHSPMYFFPLNLPSLEICYTSINLPRLLANFLTGDRTTSAQDCMAQLFLWISCRSRRAWGGRKPPPPCVRSERLLIHPCGQHFLRDTSVYLLPGTPPLTNLNQIFSFFYTILTPLVNPLSLRNREVKQASRKAIRKAVACTESAR
ncbi:LOW QUALITY PROTEIN: olfactory receptor 11L1-like [Theristicus caerulescens]